MTHDEAFAAVLGESPRLERLVSTDAHEGPVYVAEEDALYFTTMPRHGDEPLGAPRVAIKRLALDGTRFPLEPGRVSVVRERANVANGMTLDLDGRLLVCEQGSRFEHARISRLDRATGAVETVVDGLRLNSPNDVVVRSDGTVWFTDPSYGYLQGFRPEPLAGDYVYRYDPRSKGLAVVADACDKPNGLAFSPDERVLYVGDNGAPHQLLAFDVDDGGRLAGGRIVARGTPGHPDGVLVDAEGRIYVSASSGIQVFGATGILLGEIVLPGAVNFTFGGRGGNILFITADTAIWAAVLAVTGTRVPTSTSSKEA